MKKMINKLLMLATENLPARAIDLDGKHYIERYHVAHVCGALIALHRYLGCDGDGKTHSHPCSLAVGIPLAGGYSEERVRHFTAGGWVSKMVNIRPWRWNFMLRTAFHRVAYVEPGTWTLFIMFGKDDDWLFADSVGGSVVLSKPDCAGKTREWWKTADKGWLFRHKRGTF